MKWMMAEALLSFRRRPWTHGAWLLALTLCLGCIGWVHSHAKGTENLLLRLDPAGEVWAFLTPEQPADEAAKLLKKLEALPSVASARILASDEVRRRLAAELRDPEGAAEIPEALLPRAVHVLPPKGRQVTPAAVTILRASPGVESVDAGALELMRTRKRLRQVHTGANLLSLLLSATLLILGIALGRLVMSMRRDEIAVMRLLGATRDRLIGPLLITGIGVGVAAGLGGFIMSAALGAWMQANSDLAVVMTAGLALRLIVLGVITQVAGTGLGMLSELNRPELES